MAKLTLEERLWRRVVGREDPDGHWVVVPANGKPSQAKTRPGQYVNLEIEPGKCIGAHRLAWELLIGPIPPGYEVDHDPSCPKRCVNPKHMQLLTKREHALVSIERGERPKFPKLVDTCTRGLHPWPECTTLNGRQCRYCANERRRERRRVLRLARSA